MDHKIKSNLRQLSPDEVELFMKDGYLVIRDVFPKEITDRIIPLICKELKIDINNPSTWPRHLVTLQKVLQKQKNKLPSNWHKFTPVVVLRKELNTELLDEIYTERYKGIIDDLCGHGRWKQNSGIGHWPILFPIFKGQSWQPLEGGWHLDGDFKRLSINSAGDWGLILMHLFTDIQLGGGGTAVRLGSHHYTARILAEAGPHGLERDELIIRLLTATRHLPVKEIIGNNGDLILMHPWIVHTSSLNTGEQLRIAANKHISLYAPLNFKRKKKSDLSPVELTVVNSIVEHGFRLPFGKNELLHTPKKSVSQRKITLKAIIKRIRRLPYFNVKDIVRIIVLASNTYWPFFTLNKKTYQLAIKSFGKLCSKYPEIKSVYLRHPLTEGNWTPALSDLDLTVIIRKDLAAEIEFDFLNSFWGNFKRLKKFFPMFGEIYMLNVANFELWQKLEFEGQNIQNWSLLSGSDIIKSYDLKGNSFNSDGFDHAFSFYLNHFLELYNHKRVSSRLALIDLARVKNKIFKCIYNTGNNHIVTDNLNSVILSKTELFHGVVQKLKESLSTKLLPPSDINNQWKKKAEEKNNLFEDYDIVDLNGLSSLSDNIQSIYLNYNKKMFIILKDGLDRSTVNNCLDVIAKTFSDEERLPIILNVNFFRYFLQQYKPFEYGHFIAYRTLIFGTDILPDIAPPDKLAITNKLIMEASEIIKFPFSQKFFSSTGKWNSVPEFAHIFDTTLMIKHYLEHDFIVPWYQDFLENSRKASPEYLEKIEDLRTRSEKLKDKSLHFEWFKLFKQLADDTQKSILTSNKFPTIPNEILINY